MKKILKYAVLIFITLGGLVILNGCRDVTRVIKIEYPPGSEDSAWVKTLLGGGLSKYHPVIAVNRFSDEVGTGYVVGAIYSRSGKKIETLVADEKPIDILEKALVGQLEKAGFTVIRTSSWDLNPSAVPTYLKADMIIGGHLKEFSVESKAGLLFSTIDSKVAYDLVIADARNQKLIWEGQTSGRETKKTLVHTDNYYWNDIQTSINNSFIAAIRQTLQDEQTQQTIIDLFQNH